MRLYALCDQDLLDSNNIKIEEFVEIAPGINVELDDRGQVIGIEILNASKCLKPIAKPLYKHMQMAQ